MTHPKHASTDHDVLDLIRQRWSPRAYDAVRPVSTDVLMQLFEAARWAPSSRNEQPWRFVVIDRVAHADVHARLVPALSQGNQAWAPDAPVLVVVAVKLTWGDTTDANRHAWYDTGQAVALLTMQAQSMGLGVRQMEGFDRTTVASELHVPPSFDIAVIMAIGYPGEPEQLRHQRQRELEVTPRSRRTTIESVFFGGWS